MTRSSNNNTNNNDNTIHNTTINNYYHYHYYINGDNCEISSGGDGTVTKHGGRDGDRGPMCHNCYRYGHIKRNCPDSLNSDNSTSRRERKKATRAAVAAVTTNPPAPEPATFKDLFLSNPVAATKLSPSAASPLNAVTVTSCRPQTVLATQLQPNTTTTTIPPLPAFKIPSNPLTANKLTPHTAMYVPAPLNFGIPTGSYAKEEEEE